MGLRGRASQESTPDLTEERLVNFSKMRLVCSGGVGVGLGLVSIGGDD